MHNISSLDKKVVVNSLIWKLTERFFSQGLNLIIQIILARLLLPEDFGSLAIIVAIVNYATIFVQSGIATAIIQKKEIDELDISTVLFLSLIVALFFYVILFFVSPYIAKFYATPILCPTLRVLSLLLFLNAFNSVQTAILSRRMQFKELCIRSMIAVPVSGMIGITAAYMGAGLWALVAFNLSNILIVVIIMLFTVRIRFRPTIQINRVKSIYSFSGKILISNLISGSQDILRTMLIGKTYTKNDLAYYDKASTYSYYSVMILNSTVTSVMLPTFSRVQDSIDELRKFVRRSLQISLFVMIPFLLGIAAMAEPIIHIVLTDKWLPCVPYLQIFCVLRIPGIIVNTDRQAYFALGRSDIALYYEIILFALNTILLVISIKYGVMWIAITACCVEYFGLGVISAISTRVYNYSWSDRIIDFIKPTICSIIMVVFIHLVGLIDFNLYFKCFIQIIVGLVVYFIASYAINSGIYNYVKNMIIDIFCNFLRKRTQQ